MRCKFLYNMIFIVIGINFSAAYAQNGPDKEDIGPGKTLGLKIENILTSQLELVEGTEVIVSIVEVPPNTNLPEHWHPGEEFAYVLEGEAILWQEGKSDTVLTTGQVFKVPLKQIHTAKTKDKGAKILVFRVHEKGKPVRVNVE